MAELGSGGTGTLLLVILLGIAQASIRSCHVNEY